jgi:non-specific serine/threonine protein kinase
LLATLREVLGPKHLLLVLDNCEHVIAECAHVTDALLSACPHLRVLATSREALGITGETSWRVPSLTVPEGRGASDPETLTRYEGVRLFVDRAVAVQPHFAITPANASAVAQICRQLDGIPLALEMAAARLRGLSAEMLAVRLEQGFRLLTGGSRTALPRQQTLRATVDWSYSLLSPAEQRLFARLSVFAGGWTLEAAEAICTGEGIAEEEVTDLLLRLVDKSLVVVKEAEEGTARYGLLETLRQYGQERLVTFGEVDLAADRHSTYYLALAERAEPELRGPAQVRWFEHLEREHDNLRAALTWCLHVAAQQQGDQSAAAAESGLRLAGALWRFWFFRDHHGEGRTWLERALVRGAEAAAAARAKALCGAGALAWIPSDLERAQDMLTQAVALYREHGSKAKLAYALRVCEAKGQRGQQACAQRQGGVE